MKKLILLALVFVFAAVAQTPAQTKYKVVFDAAAPQSDAWDFLIAHVTNMKAALDKEGGVSTEVIFYGPGLAMLTKKGGAKYEAQLKALNAAGVKLSACQNAMKFYNVTSQDLFPFASEVDSAMAEIVRKQNAGWAYIK